MARQNLPRFSFETGICLWRSIPDIQGPRTRQQWWVIGRLEDGIPFLLSYLDGGVTQWDCAQQLGDGLRKRILNSFRETVRQAEAVPAWLSVRDVRPLDDTDFNAGCASAEAIIHAFFRDIWRAQYLDDHDADYADLVVPFAEKDAARAAGAQWDGVRKTWRINVKRVALATVSRWLPAP